MPTIADWYDRVNEAWPAEIPPMTAAGAINAARRLYRFVRNRTWTGTVLVVTGNRYTKIRSGALRVNLDRVEHRRNDEGQWVLVGGWRAFVHQLSHSLHNGKPHSKQHARLELRLIKEVLKRGWLDTVPVEEPAGVLAEAPVPTAPPAPSRAEIALVRAKKKLEGIAKSEKRWTTKAKRADTAIKKLTRKRRYLERTYPELANAA